MDDGSSSKGEWFPSVPIINNCCAGEDKSSPDQYATRWNVAKEDKIHYLKCDKQRRQIDSRHSCEVDRSRVQKKSVHGQKERRQREQPDATSQRVRRAKCDSHHSITHRLENCRQHHIYENSHE